MNKVLCLLTLALWVAPFACAQDDNIIDGVVKVINVIGKPSRLSTVFCGNVGKEYQLIRALSTINGSDQISISRLEGNSEYFKHFIVVDVALCDRSQLLSIFKDNPMGLAYSQWLLINSLNPFGTTDFNEIQDTFSQVDITQMSEVMFLTTESYKLKLCMVYKMERLRPGALIFEDFGYFPNFSLSHFIDTRVQTVTSMRRKNMQGLPLPMATVLDNLDSLNHFYDFVDVEIDPVAKSGHRLGVTVLQFMNATPELVVSRSWGIRNTTTGQWSGMMGDLISGRAEFGGTPSLLRSERAEIVEFLSISLESWTRIVFRAPKLSYTTNVYLMPFERSVWMASLALFATMTCLLLLSGICERKLTAAAGTKERPRIIDIAFVIFSAICNQGSSFNPLSVGGRIVLLSCLVLVVVLFVSYCAFIVVLLQSPATNIKTAQDVLNSRMQIGAEDTLYNRFWLKVRYDSPTFAGVLNRVWFNLETGGSGRENHLREAHNEQRWQHQLLIVGGRSEEDSAGCLCFPHGDTTWLQDCV